VAVAVPAIALDQNRARRDRIDPDAVRHEFQRPTLGIVRHGFPMDRLGTAEDVADVIGSLASPRARWINGRNIPVDGLEQPHAPLDRRPY
jgi:NAD(P)-dependent dehydrogenase (short-subunit alcohol dehydrogenase family)